MVLITTPRAATSVLTQAGAAQLPTQWLGLSASWTSTLATSSVASYLKDHLSVVTDGPDYRDGRVDGQVELVRIKAGYSPALPPDPWFTVGFLQAEAVTQLLEKAVALGDLSRAGILRASTRRSARCPSPASAGAFTYGPVAARKPPLSSSISNVDPTSPTGLTVSVRRVQRAVRRGGAPLPLRPPAERPGPRRQTGGRPEGLGHGRVHHPTAGHVAARRPASDPGGRPRRCRARPAPRGRGGWRW